MTEPTHPTRYALLRHDCPAGYRDGPHWDLMLERPGAKSCAKAERRLATWALATLPSPWLRALGREGAATAPEGPVEATPLPDHRGAYLDYEGPVSGGRGRVERWAEGRVEWLVDRPGRVEARLDGPIRGLLTLQATGEAWSLLFQGD